MAVLRPGVASGPIDPLTQFRRDCVYFYLRSEVGSAEAHKFITFTKSKDKIIVNLYLPERILTASEVDDTFGDDAARRYKGIIPPWCID